MAKSKKSGSKSAKPSKRILSRLKTLTLGLTVILLLSIASASTFYLFFLNKIYPAVYVGNISLSGLTISQARAKLAQVIDQKTQISLALQTPSGENVTLALSGYKTAFNLDEAVNQAFTYGHSRFYNQPIHLSLMDFYQPTSNLALQNLESTVNQPAINSQIQVDPTLQISVSPSQVGLNTNQAKLNQQLANYFSATSPAPTILPVETISPTLNYQTGLAIKNYLEKVQQQPITISFQPTDNSPLLKTDQPVNLDFPTLLSLLNLSQTNSSLALGSINQQPFVINSIQVGKQSTTNYQLTFNLGKLTSYLNNLALLINRPVKEPVFNFDPKANNGQGRVMDFQAPQEGQTLDIKGSVLAFNQALLSDNQTQINLPVVITPVHNKLINQLGIKELLGEGVSHFAGSTPERVFNLSLAASRVNGSLVAPGATFSFDKAVGEISGATGYKEGYIIQNGRTVLDDGGGVCQDPTTLFRAVLYAGLPVVDRTAHAYRVEYYEEGFPPGLDATIYSPTVDFKFKNDTKNYILIETHVDTSTNTLYYDLYGTPDGRVATLTTPIVTNITPAPPPLYQNDPTLPQGVVKQTDYAVNGANVVFSRTVTRDGQTLIQETYHSNYKPWQAVYLVGTKT